MNERYYDLHAEEYDAWYDHPVAQAENRVVRSWVREGLFDRTGPRSVVDLGCGTGLGYRMLAGAWRYVGVDPSVAMLSAAAARHPANFHREWELMTAEDYLPKLPTARTDRVVALWSFQFLDDPPFVVQQVARVLAPGASFVFVTYRQRTDGLPERCYTIQQLRELFAGWTLRARALTIVRRPALVAPLTRPLNAGQYLLVRATPLALGWGRANAAAPTVADQARAEMAVEDAYVGPEPDDALLGPFTEYDTLEQ